LAKLWLLFQFQQADVAATVEKKRVLRVLQIIKLKEICRRLTGDGGGHDERELGWRRTS